MCNKGILGGKIANAVDIHQEALHLALQPVMMPILFLMKSNQRLSVIENTRSLLGSLGNCAIGGFSKGRMWCTCSSSQRIHTSDCFNSFNVLRKTLMLSILKVEWVLCWLGVDGFNGHINIRQKYNMVAR